MALGANRQNGKQEKGIYTLSKEKEFTVIEMLCIGVYL